MKLVPTFVRLSVLPAIVLFVFAVCTCDLPQKESDLPIEEWEVTKVEFYPSETTAGALYVYISGAGGDIGNFAYSKDFERNNPLNGTDLLSVPSIDFFCITFASFYTTEPGITIPPGSEVTFYNDLFYQVDTSGSLGSEYVAKIRIITLKKEITIIDNG